MPLKTYSFPSSAFAKIAIAIFAVGSVALVSVALSPFGTRFRLEAPLLFAEMRYGRGSSQYMDALLVLAREYAKQKEYLSAEAQYLQACKVAQATMKGDTFTITKIKFELAEFYWNIGEKSKAAAMFSNQIDPALHREMGKLISERQFDKALKVGLMSMRGREKYSPELRGQIYHMQIWMGIISFLAKKYDDAEKFLTAGIGNFEAVGVVNNAVVATAYRHLADTYALTNRPDRAEQMYKKVVLIGESTAHVADLEMLISYLHLSMAAIRRGNMHRAETFWLKIEDFERKRPGAKPTDKNILSVAIRRHAAVMRRTNREAEALALENEFNPKIGGK